MNQMFYRAFAILHNSLTRHAKKIAIGAAIASVGIVGAGLYSQSQVSDPCHVNGAVYCVVNSNVTFATRQTTICVPGWTKTIRPSVSYTDNLKSEQMAAEGLAGTPSDYEEDHRLPLTGGGNPTDKYNLSPESWLSAHVKDQDETQLGHDLCNAKSEQEFRDLQTKFIQKWLAPYPGYK